MVSQAIRQHARTTLAHMPWAWQFLRHYVRYSPRGWVAQGINERVERFFAHHSHRFITRTTRGQRIEGETRDIIQRYLFLYGCWEPNLTHWLSERLRPGDVFVDVGANIGYYSLLAADIVGSSGGVVAIEASPSIFASLSANIRLNRAHNIRLLQVAAADGGGKRRLFRAPAHNLGASSTYADIGYEDEGEVDAHPLHQLLTADEIARARIVKIDVEGAEAAVVQGLLPLLDRARADLEIVIEVGGGPAGSPTARQSAAAIIAPLARHGFHVYRILNDYQPMAYVRKDATARPISVRSAESVSQECDLVFSRQATSTL